jgi:hypothetical protein
MEEPVPYPVHILDKMLKNGLGFVSLAEYLDDDNWYLKEQIAQGKALTLEELNSLVFGLEQLEFDGAMFEGEEGLGCEANRSTIYRIPLVYKGRTFTFSFCLFKFPPAHLKGGIVHYTVGRELLPVSTAFQLTDAGYIRKPEYADV